MKYAALLTITTLLAAPTLSHAAETKTYSYDAQGRLIRVQSSGNAPAARVTTYTYDKAHNRTRANTVKSPPAP